MVLPAGERPALHDRQAQPGAARTVREQSLSAAPRLPVRRVSVRRRLPALALSRACSLSYSAPSSALFRWVRRWLQSPGHASRAEPPARRRRMWKRPVPPLLRQPALGPHSGVARSRLPHRRPQYTRAPPRQTPACLNPLQISLVRTVVLFLLTQGPYPITLSA